MRLCFVVVCILLLMLGTVSLSTTSSAAKPKQTPPGHAKTPPGQKPTDVPLPPTLAPPTLVPPTSVPPTSVPPTATTTGGGGSFEGIPKCSQARHNAYGAVAPNGVVYPTWHPIIDSENGAPCSHQHDHGNNPALLHPDWHPAFGYVAAQMGMTEPHEGFKVMVVPGNQDQPVGVVVHMGGSGPGRFCVRFHTFETVWLANDGSIGGNIRIMGDFGIAVYNRDTAIHLSPPACPNQASLNEASTGRRMIPSQHDFAAYEPWRVDLKRTVFGFQGDFTINSRSASVVCQTVPSCPAVTIIQTSNHQGTGTVRFMTPNQTPQNLNIFFRIDASQAKATGEFCTDALGRSVVACSTSGAVVQYIRPTLFALYPCLGHSSIDSVYDLAVCGADSRNVNEPGGVPPGAAN